MTIEARCRGCGQLLTAPDSAAGRKAKCPACGDIVEVPRGEYASLALDEESFVDDDGLDPFDAHFNPPASRQPPVPTAPDRPCPVCGEYIKASAIRCRFCGEDLFGGTYARPIYRAAPHSGMAIASLVLGVLSLVLICVWFLSPLLALLAILMGISDISGSRGQRQDSSGLAIAGLVCGLVAGTVWAILFVGIFGNGIRF